MNNYEKTYTKAQLLEEKRALKELKKSYEKAKKDVERKISELNSRKDLQNLESIIHQKKYQELILKQINGVLKDLNNNQYETMDDFFKGSYSTGYTASMWSMYQQDIPFVIPIDPKMMDRAIKTKSKLSDKYYQNRIFPENLATLKRHIRQEITRGIASGKTWVDVAWELAEGMNSPFRTALSDAMRIIRTEGHRINQQGFLDAGDEAKKHGADIVKQWDATLDSKTRPAHQLADGQLKEWDDYFIVGGEKMKAPGCGGSARNVCNCRCQLLQRAKWMLDEDELKELQNRANFFGLDKSQEFDEFRTKYLGLPKKADTMKIEPKNRFIGHPNCNIANALGKDNYDNMVKLLNDNCSNDNVLKMWDMFEESVVGNFQHSGGAYCSGRRIYVNALIDAKGSNWRSPFQVICHESGHLIDKSCTNLDKKCSEFFSQRSWGFSSGYKDGIFQKTIRDEIMEKINHLDKEMKAEYKAHKDDFDWMKRNGYVDFWDNIEKYSKSRAYEEFEKEIRKIDIDKRGNISDIIEGATKGKVQSGFGHGKSYWSGGNISDENLALEAFAEMTDATLSNPKNLEMIKKYVPKAYDVYLEMVESILEGKV